MAPSQGHQARPTTVRPRERLTTDGRGGRSTVHLQVRLVIRDRLAANYYRQHVLTTRSDIPIVHRSGRLNSLAVDQSARAEPSSRRPASARPATAYRGCSENLRAADVPQSVKVRWWWEWWCCCCCCFPCFFVVLVLLALLGALLLPFLLVLLALLVLRVLIAPSLCALAATVHVHGLNCIILTALRPGLRTVGWSPATVGTAGDGLAAGDGDLAAAAGPDGSEAAARQRERASVTSRTSGSEG